MEVDEMTDHHLGEEVDDLMEMLVEPILILLVQEKKFDDLMDMDEVANCLT